MIRFKDWKTPRSLNFPLCLIKETKALSAQQGEKKGYQIRATQGREIRFTLKISADKIG